MSGTEQSGPRLAVALSYEPGVKRAPTIAASGRGVIAEEIVRRAREAGVPVERDDALVAVLSQLDLNEMIPPELYQVVAEVLAYVYRLERRAGGGR